MSDPQQEDAVLNERQQKYKDLSPTDKKLLVRSAALDGAQNYRSRSRLRSSKKDAGNANSEQLNRSLFNEIAKEGVKATGAPPSTFRDALKAQLAPVPGSLKNNGRRRALCTYEEELLLKWMERQRRMNQCPTTDDIIAHVGCRLRLLASAKA